LYASTLVLICRMLWAQDPLVLVVLIWMYWWSGTSTRLFRIAIILIKYTYLEERSIYLNKQRPLYF
jgi:hypothetical protein